MNLWEAVKQLQLYMQQQVWDVSPAKPVFAEKSVITTVAPEEEALDDCQDPICLIIPKEGQADPEFREEPGLMRSTIGIMLITKQEGDKLGERVLVGANRTGGLGTSTGRGLLEILPMVFDVTRLMNDVQGIRIQLTTDSNIASRLLAEDMTVNAIECSMEAWLVKDRYYAPPRKFSSSVNTGASITLSWTLPATRWDTWKPILVRKSGSSAPSTPSDGTLVATVVGSTSATDTPGAGTFSYGLWMAYDETHPLAAAKVAQRYSARLAVTGVHI